MDVNVSATYKATRIICTLGLINDLSVKMKMFINFLKYCDSFPVTGETCGYDFIRLYLLLTFNFTLVLRFIMFSLGKWQ